MTLMIKILFIFVSSLTVYGYERNERCFLREYLAQKDGSYLMEPHIANNKDTEKGMKNIHLPRELCDYTHFVKKIINPYKGITHQVPIISTADDTISVCLQCAACLLIAQEINGAIKKIKLGVSDPEIEISQIQCALQDTCNRDFNKFHLETKEGCSIVTRNINENGDINKSHNGKWPGRLREFCTKYVSHINVFIFYNSLLKDKLEIENFLCRGDGVFRDCTNVNYMTIPITEKYTNKQIILKMECK